jgi:hypothetical protein
MVRYWDAFVLQFPLALHVLFDVQLLFAPHDTLSDFAASMHGLQSVGARDAQPFISPATAATMMTLLIL